MVSRSTTKKLSNYTVDFFVFTKVLKSYESLLNGGGFCSSILALEHTEHKVGLLAEHKEGSLAVVVYYGGCDG